MRLIDKKAILSRAVSSILVFSLFLSSSPLSFAQNVSSTDSGIQVVQAGFSDVARTHPSYTAITYLSEKGVIGGYSDGTFKPENSINKAEVLKIIVGGSGIQTDEAFAQHFPDVGEGDWFAPFVLKAKALGFVKGNDSDGTFAPGKQVNMAEFLKMLLLANQIDVSAFEGQVVAPNIDVNAWFASYVNYAAALGIVPRDAEGNVDAGKNLTRAEVVNAMYLLSIILNGSDTQFLLTRAESEMAQIEVYIAANQVGLAKAASELADDVMQQALKNIPDNNVVLGAAKISRSYDWLVDAFILGIQGDKVAAAQKANDSIDKATEAWEANNATQPIAAHIKERAREILKQVDGTES